LPAADLTAVPRPAVDLLAAPFRADAAAFLGAAAFFDAAPFDATLFDAAPLDAAPFEAVAFDAPPRAPPVLLVAAFEALPRDDAAPALRLLLFEGAEDFLLAADFFDAAPPRPFEVAIVVVGSYEL
jgi:hypothetical protein